MITGPFFGPFMVSSIEIARKLYSYSEENVCRKKKTQASGSKLKRTKSVAALLVFFSSSSYSGRVKTTDLGLI